MSKRALRWLLPILALLLIATIMVLSPIISTHAAGTTDPTAPTAPSQQPIPSSYWYF